MKGLVFLGLSALVVASPAVAKKARHHHATVKKAAAATPAELKWMDGPPGLPGGATFAVKKGNPEKAGMFTIGIKMPAGYSVPPHWHPTDEHVTVVSGKVAYGMNDRMSRLAGQGAEVEVSAMGPFKITYVNPADDPRGAAKPAAKPTK
jgi:quercetin dioxygenase-like cupin family protein